MKVKEKIEDFVVSEIIDLVPEGKGDYAFYLLKKYDISSWDAIGKIAKKFRISMNEIGYGGLKDKRAWAHQFITIKGGPKRDLREKNFELIYLGQTFRPLSKDLLLGNRFEIVVREVEIREEDLKREIELIKLFGLANYFDEQRFGSVKSSKEFAVKEVIRGNFERALYLMLVEGSAVDIEKTRKLRECLKKNWKNPEKCKDLAQIGWERNLIEFLSQHKPSKRTFKRALNLVDKEYLFFLGNAYQSYLWNEILKELLMKMNLKLYKVPYLLGEFYFYKEVSEELWEKFKSLKLPLPAPKLKLETLNALNLKEIYSEVLQKEGISELKNFRTFIKGLIFKTYPRPAVVFPKELSYEKLNEKTYKLKFFLEKGSYATLVIKRLFYVSKNS
ncbi:MAG: tRNA pseudouridine(13) synthase TruD [Thermodesulfobacteriaceae bacterium]|nr:tRNA pseudouridine(13) synthase TruD [Thermodesulfobacteriaceae bacterium]MCX8042402.1 tRNA pseudouridine(13) synthase TruD [Thermodesulfobacteriaceae bacterium]MDW8135387.1 tRNA pseudouridine(13) synthase TruD [Thermodesulfobacterium sp.]